MDANELIRELARRMECTDKEAASILSSMTGIMGEKLQEGQRFSCDELGDFDTEKCLECIMQDPVTHRRMLIPPQLRLRYTPAKTLYDKQKR